LSEIERVVDPVALAALAEAQTLRVELFNVLLNCRDSEASECECASGERGEIGKAGEARFIVADHEVVGRRRQR